MKAKKPASFSFFFSFPFGFRKLLEMPDSLSATIFLFLPFSFSLSLCIAKLTQYRLTHTHSHTNQANQVNYTATNPKRNQTLQFDGESVRQTWCCSAVVFVQIIIVFGIYKNILVKFFLQC